MGTMPHLGLSRGGDYGSPGAAGTRQWGECPSRRREPCWGAGCGRTPSHPHDAPLSPRSGCGAAPRPAAASPAARSWRIRRCRSPLPHLRVIGQPLFVTFRLYGSLPASRPFPASNITSGKAFVTMDRLLDQAQCGGDFAQATWRCPARSPRLPEGKPTCCSNGQAAPFAETTALTDWFGAAKSSSAGRPGRPPQSLRRSSRQCRLPAAKPAS